MKKFFILSILCGLSVSLCAQNKTAIKFGKTISQKDLKARLAVIASDSLEGRNTGEPGQKKAAKYLQEQFELMGLAPCVPTASGKSYIQTYPIKKVSNRAGYMRRGEETKTNFEDYLFYSRQETMGEEFVDFLFAGNKRIDELKEMDLEGKFVAIISDELTNWRSASAQLEELKAGGVLLISEDRSRFEFMIARYGQSLKKPKITLEVNDSSNKIIIGTPELAEWIFETPYEELKSNGLGKIGRVILNSDMLLEDLEAENVMGFIEGHTKPEEVLIISAHYDHIGVNEDGAINNGADDDGSGTTTVLELAEAFARAKKAGKGPYRSILFLLVSGEEKGLLGSKYYVNNPIFPIKNTVTNLNVDMVGRSDPNHEDKPPYVYVIGADRLSQELHDISAAANETYTGIDLDYTYNDEKDPNRYYYRSDHYNFAKKGVPIIFYFNGTHADYHKPTDTIEKIEFELMEKRAKLIYFTAWELANRENRVKLNLD
ncbi:MAG: M28 family peptidase [Cyclobacteriaceae bacterium]